MNDISELREHINYVNRVFLKEGHSYIFLDGYENLREILCLLAKQGNLIESTLLLVENSMFEEAIVLCRSAVNNYFLIVYLLGDNEKRSRLREYQAQPLISRKFFLDNLKDVSRQNWFKENEKKHGTQFSEDKWRKERRKIVAELKKINMEKKKPISIRTLAKNGDSSTYGIYSTIYANASKYEHSDISTLSIYKEKVDDISTDRVFIMNTSKTDETLRATIMDTVRMIYGDSIIKIIHELNREKELINSLYTEEDLVELMVRTKKECIK